MSKVKALFFGASLLAALPVVAQAQSVQSVTGRWCAGTSYPLDASGKPQANSQVFARLIYKFNDEGGGRVSLDANWAFNNHSYDAATRPMPGMSSSTGSEGTYSGNAMRIVGKGTGSINDFTITGPSQLSFHILSQGKQFGGTMTCGPQETASR